MGFSLAFFPLGADEGLSEINSAVGQTWINTFDQINHNQPNFVISREAWNKLCSPGRIRGRRGLFDVYALVFCYGIDMIYDPPISSNFFFRVRRILKTKPHPITHKSLYVDTEKIGYVNLDIAKNNQQTGRKDNCLRLISPRNRNEFQWVKDRIVSFGSDVKQTKFRKRLPEGDGYVDENPKIKVLEEGNIFGKHRILDELLNGKYAPEAREREGQEPVDYVTVNFAFNQKTKSILFVFNINLDYGTTGIKCPQPRVCDNT